MVQVHVTRACDNACYYCTQGSNLGGKTGFMAPDQFREAVESLRGYFGVVGVFGGNPALSPHFAEYCAILRELVPFEQRGLWCNNPVTVEKAQEMRRTFNPAHSNLNVHLDAEAYTTFKRGWPESMPFGLKNDSRHSPVHLAMCDVLLDESQRWELISGCDINQHWSAMVCMFRGELRAFFCEVAGAQAMLHQDDPSYPDTGLRVCDHEVLVRPSERVETTVCKWWQLGMPSFAHQVRKHCHECAVPLRGHGQLAIGGEGCELTSETHAGVYKPKRRERGVEIATDLQDLGLERVGRVIDYVKNGAR